MIAPVFLFKDCFAILHSHKVTYYSNPCLCVIRQEGVCLRFGQIHLLSSYHWHDWIYGIMWFSSPLFATNSASVQSSPTSVQSSPTRDLNSPTRDSVVGEFHLLNKYIKDLYNIPSGGIACAHASDSWGVAPSVRKLISRTASDMGLCRRAWRLDNLTCRMLIT